MVRKSSKDILEAVFHLSRERFKAMKQPHVGWSRHVSMSNDMKTQKKKSTSSKVGKNSKFNQKEIRQALKAQTIVVEGE